MSLDVCVAGCEFLRDIGDDDPDEPWTYMHWAPLYLPFTSFEIYTLIDAGVGRNDGVPVRTFSVQEDEACRGVETIGVLVQMYIDAYDCGVWVRDGEGDWVYDLEKLSPEDRRLRIL